MLDMLRHKVKPKSDAPSTTQPEKSDSPSSIRTTASHNTSSVQDATKKLPRIRTSAEARACLLDARLIEPEPDNPPVLDTLADALGQISLFPGLSQVARDAICSVALLLAQTTPADGGEASADGLVGHMMDKFTEAVKAVTQAAISEVKSASSTLTESSTQIAATTISYRDALKNTAASPTTAAVTMDTRVHAREGVKAWQVLIDAPDPSQQLHQGADNVQLVSLANDALKDMEDPQPHCFAGARQLNNGRLLHEMDSEEAATWLSGPFARATFLGRFAPNATFKSHTYSLVIQFVLLHFKLNNNNELHALEELNGLPPNTFHWVR